MFIINFCLNMFRASLCPSSGEQRPCYCIWCVVLVLLDVVGSGCGSLRCRMRALLASSSYYESSRSSLETPRHVRVSSVAVQLQMKHPACHSLPSVGSKWKLICESELKIELAQSHKLSWCLVGINGHIVFMVVPEERRFTAGE